MKRTLSYLVALLLVGAALTACGGDNEKSSSSTSTSASATTASASFNDADVRFVQMMIPHHRDAVEMAKLADTRAGSAQVKDLAARIKNAQGPEIDTMTKWLELWGKAEAGDDMSGSDPTMGGGMSQDEMTSLEAATGPPFDKMFLTMMTAHHNGAVEMANTEIDKGQDPEAVAMAKDIVKAQEAEITEMAEMLKGVG